MSLWRMDRRAVVLCCLALLTCATLASQGAVAVSLPQGAHAVVVVTSSSPVGCEVEKTGTGPMLISFDGHTVSSAEGTMRLFLGTSDGQCPGAAGVDLLVNQQGTGSTSIECAAGGSYVFGDAHLLTAKFRRPECIFLHFGKLVDDHFLSSGSATFDFPSDDGVGVITLK